MVKGEDVNVAHTEYFVLNDDFKDILDFKDIFKEIGNDFEEVSESESNTKAIHYAYFRFDHLF